MYTPSLRKQSGFFFCFKMEAGDLWTKRQHNNMDDLKCATEQTDRPLIVASKTIFLFNPLYYYLISVIVPEGNNANSFLFYLCP